MCIRDRLDAVTAIVIAEGYATADTLSQALSCPVVAAFDSGNLLKVAQVLQNKYPQKPIVIAGDDDLTQESINGKNPGKEKAMEAAQLVNGAVVPVSYTHLRAHETVLDLVCRLLLEKKNTAHNNVYDNTIIHTTTT